MGDYMSYQQHCNSTCPPFVGTQQLRTVNLSSQLSSITGLIDLGNCVYECGNALCFQDPNTINIGAPGLYYVYYAGDFIETVDGDTSTVQPLINGNEIAASSLYVAPPYSGMTYTEGKGFFLSTTSFAALTFSYSTTTQTDSIEDFTVTIFRLS